LIYSFFIQWTSWNEESRFALTRAIVDEGGFEIDSFYNQTGDRLYFQDHHYSDKCPGTSFIALPIYTSWKVIYDTFFSQSFKSAHSDSSSELIYYAASIPFTYNPDPGLFILSSMFLVTTFVSSLFSALTVFLVYKISSYFTNKEKYRILLTISYGLGTLALPYSTVFLDHALTTFFTFLAFYLLFIMKKNKIQDNRLFFIAGLVAGFAVVIEISAFLFLLIYLLYLISFKRRKLLIFSVGFLVGISPLFFYNYLIFNNPFHPFGHSTYPGLLMHGWYPDRYLKGFYIEISSFSIFLSNQILNVLARLLFFPYKGLFFYNPIFILSFIGLVYMFKKNRLEAISILLIFILFILSFSLILVFFCGFCFGFRYLLPIIPFLMIPLLYVFEKINLKIILIFILVSIFVNILGLQYWESIQILITKPTMFPFEEKYQQKFLNFQVLENPLFEHYLPLFLRNGPRSRVFESMLIDSKIDIRNTPHSCGLMPPVIKKTEVPLFSLHSLGIAVLRIPFLCLVPLAIIVFLIWKEEFIKKVKISSKQRLFILLILILIFGVSFIRIKEFIYDENWLPPEFHDKKFENERWMSQDATLILFNKNRDKVKTNLIFEIEAFNRTRILEFYLNDNLIGRYEIYNKKAISQEMELEPGKNIIKFHSVSGCDRPTELGLAECDLRCLSFRVGNVHIESLKNI